MRLTAVEAGDGGHPHPGAAAPILLPGALGSNLVVSGPAIIQQPAALWRPDGACPTCGHKPDHAHAAPAKPTWKLPDAWNVPPGVCNELRRLQDLAYNGDAPAITLGACRSMLQVLFTQLPLEVTQPKTPEPKGWFQRLFGPPPAKPSRAPKRVLKRARDQHFITDALLSAGQRLPLDPEDTDKTSTSTAKQFAAFLIELADALYAQPSRLA